MVSISPRPALAVGREVRPSLSASQNGDRSEVLLLIQEYFGCGSIRPDRSDKTVKWEVRNLQLLVERIIPHFSAWPLPSGKRRDFELFADVCGRMAEKEHLQPVGLAEIVWLVAGMNPSGRRIYRPEWIIRQIEEKEGIVCPSKKLEESMKFRPARMA